MLNCGSFLKPKLMHCRSYRFYGLEYLGTGAKIILKCMLKKQYEWRGLKRSGPEQEQVTGACECGNEPSGSLTHWHTNLFTQKMISRSIYNLKIDTICMSICMCDIPFDRSILQLTNGIRHVMPSTDRKLELTAKASMAQPVSQPAVCSNGLKCGLFLD
jgi:hypothetical protein